MHRTFSSVFEHDPTRYFCLSESGHQLSKRLMSNPCGTYHFFVAASHFAPKALARSFSANGTLKKSAARAFPEGALVEDAGCLAGFIASSPLAPDLLIAKTFITHRP